MEFHQQSIQLALDSCGKNDVEITSMSDKPEGVFYRVGDTGRQLEIDSSTKVRSIADGVQEAIGEMQVK